MIAFTLILLHIFLTFSPLSSSLLSTITHSLFFSFLDQGSNESHLPMHSSYFPLYTMPYCESYPSTSIKTTIILLTLTSCLPHQSYALKMLKKNIRHHKRYFHTYQHVWQNSSAFIFQCLYCVYCFFFPCYYYALVSIF
jgi:hypothetical protein